MPTPMDDSPVDLETLLVRARAKAEAGKLDGALAAFRHILEREPGHAEAHAWVSREMFRRGDLAGAVRHCELALDGNPADLTLHNNLATAHLALLKADTAEQALAAICAELPFAFTSLLHLSRLAEVRGDARGAVIGYLRAIKTAQGRGFWSGDDNTPPWLRAAVQHAMKIADDGRGSLFLDWMRPWIKKHGRAEMRRVAECVAMYLGVNPTIYADPRQRPSFLYFPGLPVSPVFERDVLQFGEWYEAQADTIREEMLHVLDQGGDAVQPFHYDVPEERRDTLTRGAWDASFFFDAGERITAHHAACPETSKVLDHLPLDHVRDHGPEVCFSILRPGAQILPHRGVTNTRSVLHLGLVIPDGCALNLVGVQQVEWQPGRCFAFDDTYEHEAWNRSDTTRVVLLGDIWNPYLRPPEREAVASLVEFIGDFNRATTAAAPAAPSPGA